GAVLPWSGSGTAGPRVGAELSLVAKLRGETNRAVHRYGYHDPGGGILQVATDLLEERDHGVDLVVLPDHAEERLVLRAGAGGERLAAGEGGDVVREHPPHPFAVDDGGARDPKLDQAGEDLVQLLFLVDDGDQELHTILSKRSVLPEARECRDI